jgi:DNA (cytosine-5)-methyltransferase 1
MALENHPADSRVTVEEGTSIQTLTSRMGTGGGNTPLLLVVEGFDKRNQDGTGDKAHTIHQGGEGTPIIAMNMLQDPITSEDKTPCMSTGNNVNGQANLAVCYSLDRASFNQGKNAQYNIGITEGLAHTLVTNGPGAVCYPVGIHGDMSGTLDASYYKGCGERNGIERDIIAQPIETTYIVRRVTPTECARLQGMPDWWCTDIPHADSAEYKMWGNGMALPDLMYVMEGMAVELRREQFDNLFGRAE